MSFGAYIKEENIIMKKIIQLAVTEKKVTLLMAVILMISGDRKSVV